MTQLDLFDIPPASEIILAPTTVGAPPVGAAIIAFPQNRNIGKARHVAAKILERDGKAKEAYWRRICTDMASMLGRAGHSDGQVTFQIMGFHDAVCVEMDRLRSAGIQQPGGAA